MIVTPLPLDGAEDMLVDFLSLSVQLPIFPITLIVFFNSFGKFASIDLPPSCSARAK